MKTVTNTSNMTETQSALFLMEASFKGAAGTIEAQEARGQKELVESEVLPTQCLPEFKAELEAAGVKFLDVVAGDAMFQQVQLPAGWKKVATDHDMWSNLVDDKGVKRAMIFYKASFYDRKAHMGKA